MAGLFNSMLILPGLLCEWTVFIDIKGVYYWDALVDLYDIILVIIGYGHATVCISKHVS